MDPELATPGDRGLSDEEVLSRLAARDPRPDDPPWPSDQAEMLFLTRISFGVGLAEAAEANHVPWKEALIAWEYVRERARTLGPGHAPGAGDDGPAASLRPGGAPAGHAHPG